MSKICKDKNQRKEETGPPNEEERKPCTNMRCMVDTKMTKQTIKQRTQRRQTVIEKNDG